MEKNYMCKKCDEKFLTKHFLTFHMSKVHSAIPTFECNICHKNFRLSIHLDLHKKLCKTSEPGGNTSSVTDSEVESNFSEICSESESKTNKEEKKLLEKSQNTKKQSKFKKRRKDEQEKEETINEFFTKPDLEKVVKKLKRLPAGEELKYTSEIVDGKVYQRCSICKKLVINSTALLEIHRNSHLENRAHKCQYCDKSFLSMSGKIRHMRIHTDEKPYACKYCPKRFINSQTRKQHVRSHTALKLYQCKHCQNKFNNYSNMVDHIVKIHVM